VNGAFRASPDAALQRPHVLTSKSQVQGGHAILVSTQLERMRTAKSSTQPCKAKTWCALTF